MPLRGAQRHEHEAVGRGLGARPEQEVARSYAVAAAQGMDAETEQGLRMARLASVNLEPDSLCIVPLAGAREPCRSFDELRDGRGHGAERNERRRAVAHRRSLT
jgi:hypothetical protein